MSPKNSLGLGDEEGVGKKRAYQIRSLAALQISESRTIEPVEVWGLGIWVRHPISQGSGVCRAGKTMGYLGEKSKQKSGRLSKWVANHTGLREKPYERRGFEAEGRGESRSHLSGHYGVLQALTGWTRKANGSNSKTHSLFLIPSQFLGPNQRMMKARSLNSQAVSKISKDNGV